MVTYWFDGLDPITVRVRHHDQPDVSQDASGNDLRQRQHDFAFPDVDAQTVIDVLASAPTGSCLVQPGPTAH